MQFSPLHFESKELSLSLSLPVKYRRSSSTDLIPVFGSFSFSLSLSLSFLTFHFFQELFLESLATSISAEPKYSRKGGKVEIAYHEIGESGSQVRE